MTENSASFLASVSQAGEKLGLWALIAQRGQISAGQLACGSGIDPSRAQEWLDLMTSYGSLEYTAASQAYRPRPDKN